MTNDLTPEILDTLFKQNRYAEIVDQSAAFQSANPDHEMVMMLLGIAHSRTGNVLKALPFFENAVRINPISAQAHNNLANTYRSAADFHNALTTYEKALKLNPDYAEAQNGRASVLMDLGRIEQAVNAYRQTLDQYPDNHQARLNLALALVAMGEFDEARALLQEIIVRLPNNPDGHFQYSLINRYDADDPHINKMQAVLQKPDLPPKSEVLVNLALGKAFADIRDTDKAMDHWRVGNAAFKAMVGYDFSRDRDIFNSISSWPVLQTPDPSPAKNRKKPVFVLGMPRSGTSLVEQILAGHDKIYAAGEMPAMSSMIRKFIPDYAKPGHAPTAESLADIREGYLDYLDRLPTDKMMITDKMPSNFFWVNVIRAVFPDAPIIHLKRHPMAICFSNWRHFFSTSGMRYSYDLEDIGRYYLGYDALMQRYEKDYGDAIIHVDYEALTASPRDHIADLLARLGLDWQESCVRVEDNKRSVKTVSNVQIRQKIYTKSSEEWQRYEHHLQPLKKILMPIMERDGWLEDTPSV